MSNNQDIPSCSKCPSHLMNGTSKFGRSVGTPMCASFGRPLFSPNQTEQQQESAMEAIAKNCNLYGEPVRTQPLTVGMNVMLPDPKVLKPGSPDFGIVKRDSCTSCLMCINYVPEPEVFVDTGWTAGMCVGKGRLILSNRVTIEAKDCEIRQFGMVRSSIPDTMQLFPEYGVNFGLPDTNPTKAYFKNKEHFVDPSEYPSDLQVTPEETTAGIRAWRKFEDPDGSGNTVFFPVYRRDYFDSDEQALVPETGSDEHPELYVDHFGGMYGLGVAWLELDETPCLWGQAGVGKTELYRYAAWIMQIPFRRISFNARTELDDIAGKMRFTPEKGTYFEHGRLPKGWQRPGILCLDEPNTAPPEVAQFLRPLTDNSKQLVLDMNEGEHLDRHDHCYLGMAMNPAWDMKNIGALEMADADANRLFHTFVDLPSEELEREILKERVKIDGWELEPKQVDMLMGIAKDIRGLSNDETLSITWALRQQIKVARALRWFTPPVAYLRAVGDYLDPQQRQIILDQVKHHWNS